MKTRRRRDRDRADHGQLAPAPGPRKLGTFGDQAENLEHEYRTTEPASQYEAPDNVLGPVWRDSLLAQQKDARGNRDSFLAWWAESLIPPTDEDREVVEHVRSEIRKKAPADRIERGKERARRRG